MRKILYLTILLVLALALVALVGCVGEDVDVLSVTGTVRFIDLEGGFYGIVGEDGKNYVPTNLSQEFQEDCLPICFEAKIREDIANAYMWGTMVEITKIEKLGGG